METRKEICLCAACNAMMFEGDDMVQHPVIKMGELDYIELAHRACLPEWAEFDNFDFAPYEEAAEREAAWLEAEAKAEADARAAAFAPAPRATLADLWPA